jgi:hypothetical protein
VCCCGWLRERRREVGDVTFVPQITVIEGGRAEIDLSAWRVRWQDTGYDTDLYLSSILQIARLIIRLIDFGTCASRANVTYLGDAYPFAQATCANHLEP